MCRLNYASRRIGLLSNPNSLPKSPHNSTELVKSPNINVPVFDHLQSIAERTPTAMAVAASAGGWNYEQLLVNLRYCVETLNDLGIGRNDRVGIVLPNDPAMLIALLGLISCATAAPLNPACTSMECDFFLSDLNAKAVIMLSGSDSAARKIARDRGIALIEVSTSATTEASRLRMSGETAGTASQTGYATIDDFALVLHTSGTTSRPKIVPLTQGNVLSSATNMKTTLSLTATDRCLTVMPLFHIHGLMVTVSSLFAGGTVYPTSFEAEKFFRLIEEFSPTWYSAVPTIHQAILRAMDSQRPFVTRARLRFVRSSSSALPIRVREELEGGFNTSVVEAYGMTEAAHQMASQPLASGEQKDYSVGLAAGPEVTILDDTGNFLPAGQAGEIAIRGPNVFQGYENNPEANAVAFTSGWFRTGDQGYLDSEGYLFVTGRLKEIINRGGEKISPAEVDNVLLSLSEVEQAVAFPVAHPTLGEDIVAAVVLQRNASVAEEGIRKFIAARLARFKVPQRVLILDEIPKGPTGKLQRSLLACQLGLLPCENGRPKSASIYVAPRETVEHQLVEIWQGILQVQPIGVDQNFFELGGDSLLAMQMMLRVEESFGMKVPLALLLENPTIGRLAKAIVAQRFNGTQSLLVKVQSGGASPPFFSCTETSTAVDSIV